MANKQLFLTPKLAPTDSFLSSTAEVRNFLEINTKMPFLESNVNDSMEDGLLTTARAL